MSEGGPNISVLQPVDLSYLNKLSGVTNFSAVFTNPARTSFNANTYNRPPVSASDILVDMDSSRPVTMQLVPLAHYRNRPTASGGSFVANDDNRSPDMPFSSDSSGIKANATAYWLTSAFLCGFVTPSLFLLFTMAVWYVGMYYYNMLATGIMANAVSYYDRVHFTLWCATAIYALSSTFDKMAARIGEIAYRGTITPEEATTNAIADAPTIGGLLYAMWRSVSYNFSHPIAFLADTTWYIHSTARIALQISFYMVIAGYISVLYMFLWGVPLSFLPSRNSPIIGAAVGVIEKLAGPISLPVNGWWSDTPYTMPTHLNQQDQTYAAYYQ